LRSGINDVRRSSCFLADNFSPMVSEEGEEPLAASAVPMDSCLKPALAFGGIGAPPFSKISRF
jgi:hypothetical protein